MKKTIKIIALMIVLIYTISIACSCFASYNLKVYSEAAILVEQDTGKILYKKNAHQRMYPASTTKILTCIIALEKCDLDEKAVASKEAVERLEEGYTKANIIPGEEFTIKELLLLTMLQSANEAANVIAEHISGSIEKFAELMNKRAEEMGCLNSHFVNPNGMHDENHYSTAYDLAQIARHCMNNEKYREIILTPECEIPDTEIWNNYKIENELEDEPYRKFYNTNKLIKHNSEFYYPYCVGGKAGFTTPAKNCFVTASNKDGFKTIAVVLHGELTDDEKSARYVDTINLFNYGYDNYNLEDIQKEYSGKTKKTNPKKESTKENPQVIEIDQRNYVMIALGVIVLISGFVLLKPRKKSKH